MSSDEEPGISNIVSEFETQFVPRSDDDQVLWAVQEITAERGKRYRVKWVGTDPATGRPWAQSWVPKHDCTDDLVLEWKLKKKRLTKQKERAGGGRTSTTSRSSKRGGSSTSGKMTRLSTSEATGSRGASIQAAPPKGPSSKRKRGSETLATTVTTTTRDAGKTKEQSEASPPLKRQRTMAALERLAPPLSSDEDEDAPPAPAMVMLRQKAPLKTTRNSSDDSDDDIPPPAKAKAAVRRPDVHSKGSTVGSRASDVREEPRSRDSKTRATDEVVIRPKERVVEADASPSSQDEEHLPRKSKKKLSLNRVSLSERNSDLSEERKAPPAPPIKIGPPRGVKRQKVLKDSGSSSRAGPSRIKPRKDNPDVERVPTKKSKSRPVNDIPPFGNALLLQETVVDSPTVEQPPLRLSIPPTPLSGRPPSSDLTPGTRARLELFDRMVGDAPEPEAAPPAEGPSEHGLDYSHFDHDDNHDFPDTSYPPAPLSPPPPRSKSKRLKPDTHNGAIVPETESSGNSQYQMPPLDKPPPPQPPPAHEPPRQSIDLPTIAVIVPSAGSSPASDLPPLPRKPTYSTRTKRMAMKRVPQISPNTFHSKIKPPVTAAEAPPSSIESFTSPKGTDKRKESAVEVEVDQLQSSLSEAEERRKRPEQRQITDSVLKKRGQELFDQVQLAREAARARKKAARQLKSVNDIVKGPVPSPSRVSALPFTGGVENNVELNWEEVTDLNGGANSTTLDAAEHSEAKPLGEEEREHLRIKLRQEEEENTQEALGIYPPPQSPPVKEPVLINGGDVQMPPPRSPERSLIVGRPEDVDHVEQRSTDIQLASVMVQPSQERHEDMEIDPSPAIRPTSSPPRRIPENLTDSPKRRLGEALSLLNVKSEEIQRLERELTDERKNVQNLRTELAEAQQSSVPTPAVLAAWEAERAQWAQDRSKWEQDLATWETQRKELSDDKANLSAQVAELLEATSRAEQASLKLSELEAEHAVWTKERDVLQSDITQRSEELAVLAKTRDETEQERLKWETERISWAEEKAKWETDRTVLQEKHEASSRSVDELTSSVASLTSAKVSAEKDRDFFREQYTQASEFFISVREENTELENRTKIAEGQAREGVAAIKALYEGRMETLQAEVGRWKMLAELLQEKDRRTNDALRLRAAQAPELEHRCGRLAAENKSLVAEVRKLDRAQRHSFAQQNKAHLKFLALRKERGILKAKLSKLSKAGDGSTQETSHYAPAPPAEEKLEDLGPNDMVVSPDPTPRSVDSVDEPALFPCMWRPEWRDQCRRVFDAKEDLERHMQDHFCDLSRA